jgi:hypothetical protein
MFHPPPPPPKNKPEPSAPRHQADPRAISHGLQGDDRISIFSRIRSVAIASARPSNGAYDAAAGLADLTPRQIIEIILGINPDFRGPASFIAVARAVHATGADKFWRMCVAGTGDAAPPASRAARRWPGRQTTALAAGQAPLRGSRHTSPPVDATLNYTYAILESRVRM